MFATAIAQPTSAFAVDVLEGLTKSDQKTLPASWLYDHIGSALFEVITLLPEYGLTRADGALLQSAANEIVRVAGEPENIIELGSGSGSKTRHLLSAATAFGPVGYLPIDISRAALDCCEAALRNVGRVNIQPIEATYLDGIERALAQRTDGQRALILFLGSTIGNFNRDDAQMFLQSIRKRVHPGDSLLLGADLVKTRHALLSAYDDSLGVTAAFNLNLLARMNRELDADFDLANFAHEARYNERQSRVEMHLRSLVAQKVKIGALDFTVSFRAGETIWTESSHKFRAPEIRHMGEQAGWRTAQQWLEHEWGFSETLFTA